MNNKKQENIIDKADKKLKESDGSDILDLYVS